MVIRKTIEYKGNNIFCLNTEIINILYNFVKIN